jgi:Peptidase family C25/FlgD Ig-like domain
MSYGQEPKRLYLDFSSAQPVQGAYIRKIPLTGTIAPMIKSVTRQYTQEQNTALTDSMFTKSTDVEIIGTGTERKKTYAFIRIPAYRKTDEGNYERLTNTTLDIVENISGPRREEPLKSPLARTTVSSSVLANGSWQKIAIVSRGVYKVDYDFVSNKLGQGGAIKSGDIRLFGNGGTMVHESNKVSRPDDLTENAIQVYDGGDGIFGSGDYFLFYANGPLDWEKDSLNQRFIHRTNLYADSSFYFITFDNGSGLRIASASDPGSPTTTVNSFNEYALHEKELVNLGLFGKTWWGETFDFVSGNKNRQTFSFVIPGLADSVYYRYSLASAAIGGSNAASCSVTLNGNLIGAHNDIYGISGSSGENPGVGFGSSGWAVIPSSGSLSFTIDYRKNVSTAKAYLDYIELNARRQLNFSSGTQLSFRDWRSIGPNAVARFQLSGTNPETKVWDVSNPLVPLVIPATASGGILSFNARAESLREYIAMDGNFLTPFYSGRVANQNLHGLEQSQYIIVSHPDHIPAANKLADFHRSNGLKVVVADVNMVYNEFGSGARDISAIRDFVKMFYDRAGTDEGSMPKYLLLFGQASYDYKNIVPSVARIVPTFETPESLSSTSGYSTDDFYALLDNDEYIEEGLPLMDIGIGRIPATNTEQALAVVDKIIRYKSNGSLGPWRTNNVFISDREDNAGDFILDTEAMVGTVDAASSIYKSNKVYLDNMSIVSTPGGARAPDANKQINDNVYKGTFLINYIGHGSVYTLSSKRIITQDDYNNWNNQYKMPIMITATCDFGRFDNPALQSSGEKILLKGNGGAIAMVTTTQVVYNAPNHKLNRAYLTSQFTRSADGWLPFGDAFKIAKNEVISGGDVSNSRKFALLGDPAIMPNFPRYNVQTESVKEYMDGLPIAVDSVKSLGRFIIEGSVRNDQGGIMADFDGKVNIVFFDKSQQMLVSTQNSGTKPRKYAVQNNIIYKGTATVKSGKFSFEFIAPKDINYEFGKGRLAYYADNGSIDAAGSDTSITVGGFSDYASSDEDAPLVRPFMNDSLFRNGGLTGNNSILFAIITDKSGINVSGNFVGHDLTAVLDDAVETPFILNDYYETAPNTYQRGYVHFPVTSLTNGIHSLRVKAWDVFNNSGEGSVLFEVLNGEVVKMQKLYNYPNPFRDFTRFVFEHNHPNEALKVSIRIYSTTGALMRTIEQEFVASGSNSAEVSWDGTGNAGEKLIPGIYPYRISVATKNNMEDLGYQKVVLIR